MTVELTRRDAVVALAAAGIGVVTGAAILDDRDRESRGSQEPSDHTATSSTAATDDTITRHDRETMVAVARVIYPAAVSGLDEFVGTYLDGRAKRVGFAGDLSTTIAELDAIAEDWHGDRIVDLDRPTRETLLRDVGADTAEPDPVGSLAERVRYYLVNDLLFALYASPTGGSLVGIENPQGHPGGLASYQRGPDG